jgi:hypothetical protein
MQIIEGAIPAWYPGEIKKGTQWDQMPVSHPGRADVDSVPVLVIPVPPDRLAEVKIRVTRALEDYSRGNPTG